MIHTVNTSGQLTRNSGDTTHIGDTTLLGYTITETVVTWFVPDVPSLVIPLVAHAVVVVPGFAAC